MTNKVIMHEYDGKTAEVKLTTLHTNVDAAMRFWNEVLSPDEDDMKWLFMMIFDQDAEGILEAITMLNSPIEEDHLE